MAKRRQSRPANDIYTEPLMHKLKLHNGVQTIYWRKLSDGEIVPYSVRSLFRAWELGSKWLTPELAEAILNGYEGDKPE